MILRVRFILLLFYSIKILLLQAVFESSSLRPGQEAGEIRNEGDIQITPFNMKDEMEEGHFDADGMYHLNNDAEIRDNWLENIDWVKVSSTKEYDYERRKVLA